MLSIQSSSSVAASAGMTAERAAINYTGRQPGTSQSKNYSVVCLGRVTASAGRGFLIEKESKIERLKRRVEGKRFDTEALCAGLEAKAGWRVRITSDHRGINAGGIVRIAVNGTTQMTVSTLPVEVVREGGEKAIEYFVWEITIDACRSIRPRAGQGNCDLEKYLQMIRREINGF